jgi:hypothetical protein
MTADEVHNEKNRIRYAANVEYRERAKARATQYRHDHPEKAREYSRKYRLTHPVSSEQRRENYEKYKARYKEKLANDPEFARADKHRRMLRARQRAEQQRLRYNTDEAYREQQRKRSREYQQRIRKERTINEN